MKTTSPKKYARHFALAITSLVVFELQAWNPPGVHPPVGAPKATGCSPATTITELDWNNVRTVVETGGNMWQNRAQSHAEYEIPKTALRNGPNSMYSGGLWMGGLSPDNQLKLAAVLYRQVGNDFWPGPLSHPDASITSSTCISYDRTWKTLRKDAQLHDAYYRCLATPGCDPAASFPNGYIIPSVFNEWPAIGDVSLGQDLYIAPFHDFNGDGDYNPTDGDYPGYDLGGVIDCKHKFRTDPVPLFGDQNIWWVFNDKGNAHTETGGQPIGMEVRAQAFAFSTNDEVNNMTFYNYVLINQGTQTLTHTYFGQWADPDLGCANDDYVGCDVRRGLGYDYNGDDFDEDCNGVKGYGAQPPAVGIDFFEGPFQDYDGLDNPGPQPSRPLVPCQNAVDSTGITYKGIGIGYGDGVVDNERYGMRAFIYFTRDGASWGTDPSIAVQYYNYLRSIWKDGTPMSYNPAGSGHDPNNPNPIRCYYMFPGDSDPEGWGTGCTPQSPWTEQTANRPPGDRRFVQSAGPFTLEPGAYNNITVGVVWARATGGGPFASVEEVRKADDKAQALFDNCFRILNGPDAPVLSLQELDRELILYLNNPIGSNNYKENYLEHDPTIPDSVPNGSLGHNVAADQYYRFEGYQVYQVSDGTVSVTDLSDISKARLIAVCDRRDTIKQLVNWIQNTDINLPVPTEMVNGPDTGVVHSFRITEDKFALGDPRLINFKTYYFMVLAYGYNGYEKYNPATLTGQAFPYKAGRKEATGAQIHSYSGIPHAPEAEANGTIQHSQYGDGFQITRIEGQGNGRLVLDMEQSSVDQVIAAPLYRSQEVTYKVNAGPVDVKVVDPLNVPNAKFELWVMDTTGLPNPASYLTYVSLVDAFWMLVRLDGNGFGVDTVRSDKSIAVGYEQLIPKWGLSVNVAQPLFSGSIAHLFTEALGSSYNVVGNGSFWYTGIPDQDGETPLNWIRAGTATATGGTITYKDYAGVDDKQEYEKILSGTWSPFPLIGDTAYQPGTPIVRQYINTTKISETPSMLFVFTPDKSKWSRCPVLEENNNLNLTTPAQVGKLKMRPVRSVDQNGDTLGSPNGYDAVTGDVVSDHGMSWFPGYAVDLETGERMNVAFGEDSFWGGSNGRDMIWDPSDVLITNQGFPIMGGGHWIYVFKNQQRLKNNDPFAMPLYDKGQYLHDRLFAGLGSDIPKVWKACVWVGSGLLASGAHLLSMHDGLIPSEVHLRMDVSKPYFPYKPYAGETGTPIDTSRNGGLPLYTFNTGAAATETQVHDVAVSGLDLIGIVPNPYYAFSGYETSRLDDRVKFVNVPRTCTISIYNVSGALVRKYRKDNDLTYLDWDLKNSYNVPIAGGTYICHIEVPGAGEKVLKWFGVIRPVDLQNF